MLTPEDIYEARFQVRFLGYRQDQVDAFLDRVAEDLKQRAFGSAQEHVSTTVATLQGEVKDLQRQNAELRRRNQRLMQEGGDTDRVNHLQEVLRQTRQRNDELEAQLAQQGRGQGGASSGDGHRSALDIAYDYMSKIPGSHAPSPGSTPATPYSAADDSADDYAFDDDLDYGSSLFDNERDG